MPVHRFQADEYAALRFQLEDPGDGGTIDMELRSGGTCEVEAVDIGEDRNLPVVDGNVHNGVRVRVANVGSFGFKLYDMSALVACIDPGDSALCTLNGLTWEVVQAKYIPDNVKSTRWDYSTTKMDVGHNLFYQDMPSSWTRHWNCTSQRWEDGNIVADIADAVAANAEYFMIDLERTTVRAVASDNHPTDGYWYDRYGADPTSPQVQDSWRHVQLLNEYRLDRAAAIRPLLPSSMKMGFWIDSFYQFQTRWEMCQDIVEAIAPVSDFIAFSYYWEDSDKTLEKQLTDRMGTMFKVRQMLPDTCELVAWFNTLYHGTGSPTQVEQSRIEVCLQAAEDIGCHALSFGEYVNNRAAQELITYDPGQNYVAARTSYLAS